MLLPGNLKKKGERKGTKVSTVQLRNKIFILLISEIFVSVAGNILSQSGVMKLFLSS